MYFLDIVLYQFIIMCTLYVSILITRQNYAQKQMTFLYICTFLHVYNNCIYLLVDEHICLSLFQLLHSFPPIDDILEHQVSSMGHSSSQPGSGSNEPNLNDVIDYLSSPNPANVINAASYLQHLAYGDDSMKAKIRYICMYLVMYECVYDCKFCNLSLFIKTMKDFYSNAQ